MWSCFAKRFTKTAPAPPMELFIELKPQNGFTSEVEPCQTMAMFFILLSYELGFQRGFSVTAIRDATELWWNTVPYLGSAAASC
jgi:hypothetical protein